MTTSWRARCGLAILLAVAAVAALAAPTGACGTDERVFVGTDGTGLRALRFDACAGRLGTPSVVAYVEKPRWVVADASRSRLYVAVDGSGAEGRVAAYALERRSGTLAPLGDTGAGGAGTTFLALAAASQTLLAANFGGGSVSSIALQTDGRPGPRVSTLKASGSGPHRRQASAHAHGVTVSPDGRFVLVPDLGADRVFVYGFDGATHTLLQDDGAAPRAYATAPGSGPRRVLFGAGGRVVYVLNELSAEVLTLRWDAEQGRLSPLHSQPISSDHFHGDRSAAEMMLGRDGRFLYVADRGESTLLVYRVDPASGALSLVQRLPSGGEAPWAFDLHPSGHWLAVAHHRSNRVGLFRVDPDSGRLSDTGQAVDAPRPVSLTFVN
jgi:6-phosphogluconolactonase